MGFGRLSILAAMLVTASAAGTGAQTPRPQTDNVAARLLAAHNQERARLGLGLLRWDPALAVSAASYAPRLSAIGRLQHSPRATRPGQSENLWMGTRGYYSPEQMVAYWVDERTDFRPGVFPDVSRTDNWLDVSHYTQMIWPTTTSLGCAIHSDQRRDYLVCRYAPKGNIDGRRVP